MILSGPEATKSAVQARRLHRCGFTLVEMLVVIGVMTLLIGILIPAINLAYTYAVHNSMQRNIQSISIALGAYKNDQNSYPKIDYNDTTLAVANYPGAVVLCSALIAPGNTAQDGHGNGIPAGTPTDGQAPGFTNVPKGQVYGPYLEMDRFHIMVDTGLCPTGTSTAAVALAEPSWYLADRYSHPILYFRANETASPGAANGYAAYFPPFSSGPAPMWNLFDGQGNSSAPALCWSGESGGAGSNALVRFQLMLGDLNCNGQVDGTEVPYKAPYLLWSAGPDEVFGVNLGTSSSPSSVNIQLGASRVPSCDDATSYTVNP